MVMLQNTADCGMMACDIWLQIGQVIHQVTCQVIWWQSERCMRERVGNEWLRVRNKWARTSGKLGVGFRIVTQRPDGTEKPGPWHPVGFHSQKFTSTEQNYPIYNREFLAIMRSLRNWDYLLKGTEKPVLIYTDHTNLRYYCDPRKIGPHIAGYLPEHKQYNMLLEYKPEASNWADSLSRCEDHNDGNNPENEDITVWPEKYFCKHHTNIWATSMVRSHPRDGRPGRDGENIQVMDWDTLESNLDSKIKLAQYQDQNKLKNWTAAFKQITLADRTHYYHGNTLVVMADNKLRRGVTSLFHNQLTAGHPGISKTLQLISPYYWWPNMKAFITEYIQGCATCQMNKVNTHPSHPPLSPITPVENACPFETIAMDFIMKLPPSGGHDTILMITDTDCSKASIFLPCKEAIDSEGVTQLYLTHVLPHYGLPKKIISDQDPWFTSHFGKELCHLLVLRSMGYFPFFLLLTNPFSSHDCLLDTSPDSFLAYLTAFLSSWECQLISRIVVLVFTIFSLPTYN